MHHVTSGREVKWHFPSYATYDSITATTGVHLRNLVLRPLVLVAVLLPYTSVKIRPLMVTTVPVCSALIYAVATERVHVPAL